MTDPLARWIETRFGLATESDRLVRRRPAKIEEVAGELASKSGIDAETCADAIRRTLEAGSQARHPVTERPLFAFRLHQFLSKGDTVYVTLEDKETRQLTRNYQRIQPGSDGRILLPLAFCRDCGQEYLTVWRKTENGEVRYEPRLDTDATGGRDGDGNLYLDPEQPWPESLEQVFKDRRLPESWLETDEHGHETVRDNDRKRVPWAVHVDPYGVERKGGLLAAFIPAPFLFCLHCGVSHEQKKGKDFARLATLSQEGRSSATSLVSASVVRSLNQVPEAALDKRARKLLTFVDNRQDASLQAGHFNDFVQIIQLRGALYRAVTDARDDGLRHEDLATRVAEALDLSMGDYAAFDGPGEPAPSLARIAAKTLRDVIAYRLYLDLKRGWRVTMPNLEQTGLLEIHYEDVDWLAEQQGRWAGAHPCLGDADARQRAEIVRVLLDEMRRALAIDVQYFREDFQTLQRASEERLLDPWKLTKDDEERVGTAFPWGRRPRMDSAGLYLSGRGKFGKYLERMHFPKLPIDDRQQIINDLLEVLADASMAQRVPTPLYYGRRGHRPAQTVTGYRLSARILVWRAGTGEVGAHDPLTRRYASGEGPRINPFFRELYQHPALTLSGLFAREHTAQVEQAVREDRENKFGKGELKLLYCSPTMELGVDISELSAVMMRNVPPTPANYVQRSGRAGRSGQPALVTTYCATGNSHDQYYFRRSDRMVAGVITRPRLDLANEDLIRSHVQAIWLAESELRLGQSILDVLDTGNPDYRFQNHVVDALNDSAVARRTVDAAREVLGGLLGELAATVWWHDQWIDDAIRTVPTRFNNAFERWRDLFRAAKSDQAEQNRRVLDHTLTEVDRQRAVGRRRAAETQLRLLRNETPDSRSVLSDFSPYRYLASEGFLPGYSFPRLPLAAYIPGAGGRFDDGNYLQRPRFLAIREFGPGALIYHEGARYQVRRIQLPADQSGELVTTSAKRCPSCGYHHEPEHNADKCQFCQGSLAGESHGLLKLHTVYTVRRERISSDEEERRRAGFRLVTSYRFQDHGDRPGRRDAEIVDDGGPLATVTYGDSATVRVTNVGRLRAKKDEPPGFWLDPMSGEWMGEADAAEASGDSSELATASGAEQRHKKRVIPYVDDRRNILVLRLAEPLPEGVALSLMYALERGIEAAFELEDAELTSELLPPNEGPRDRMLFTEASEGGAGVLRLMQADKEALSKAAKAALEICHFDELGNDLGGPAPDRRCARGCYDCLLTYGNQLYHGAIDRHAVRDLLVRLAGARAEPPERTESRTAKLARLTAGRESPLVTWLNQHGLHLPDEGSVLVESALARPDFVYRRDGASYAIFEDDPWQEPETTSLRDIDAEERLYNLGWEVIRFPHGEDWSAIVEQFQECFGSAASA